MKRLFAILFVCVCACSVYAQTTPKIRRLEKERNELHRQINESETLLHSTKKDVKSQLENLALLSNQIEERKGYLQVITRDVEAVQQEIRRLEVELKGLNQNLAVRKKRYAHSVQYMHMHLNIQERLMFIFAADNLNQMYRRMRYMMEYANFQKLQGSQIIKKQEEVTDKKEVLRQSKKAKEELLLQGQEEKEKLESKEKERKELLVTLQKKQHDIQKELKEKKRSADALNATIDKLIAYEIEQARKRAEEEQRRLAAERKRREAKERKSEKTNAEPQKGKQVNKQINSDKLLQVKQQELFQVDMSDRKLSGTFEKNKGKLPVPVTGACAIVGHYGQYQVAGLRHVRLDNKGIDIKARQGAMARSVFDGEVSAIFQYNNLSNVLVRHGRYISVYCNLSSVRVKKGSLLKTGDIIGQIHTDVDGNTILHFQLRQETLKLNPESWIRR